MTRIHGLSFDLEDWEQNIRRKVLGQVAEPSSAFERQVDALLEVCAQANVHATFFIVGRLARSRPALVRMLAENGHEIGCHSDEHRLIGELDRAQFREDTRVARRALEDIGGKPVRGYRAPEFSVGTLGHWCFDVLAELGFAYDSSVVPAEGPRYAIPKAPHTVFHLRTEQGTITELPLLTVRMGGRRVPAGGGTYYRLLPARTLSAAIGGAEREGANAVLYFHPYEFGSEKLWLRGAGWANVRAAKYLVAHNWRTSRIARVLSSMLKSYRFGPLADIAAGATNEVVIDRREEAVTV